MRNDQALAPRPMASPARRRRAVQTGVYTEPLTQAAITALEAAMGGRGALVAALLQVPATDDLSYVIGLIADPRNDARHLATICAEGAVTVGELLEAYKRGVLALGQVRALQAVAAGIGPVIEDAVIRAAPHYVTCRPCHGTGSITPEPTKDDPNPSPGPCEACDGTGQIYVAPDLDRQKFAADLAGLTPKKAPLVDLSDRRHLSVGDPSGHGLLTLLQSVDTLLYKSRDTAVEAEVTETPSAGDGDDLHAPDPPAG